MTDHNRKHVIVNNYLDKNGNIWQMLIPTKEEQERLLSELTTEKQEKILDEKE